MSATLLKVGDALRRVPDRLGAGAWRIELTILLVLMVVANLSLLSGHFASRLVFLPEAVAGGQWWRLLTHPFVHVSWYHLVLDAGAFFLAYPDLRSHGLSKRLAILGLAAGGSVLAAVLGDPNVATVGLCGLSGIAHGLTAWLSLQMMVNKKDPVVYWAGVGSLALLVGKSIWEAMTGNIFLGWLHFGPLGDPIAVCHAGGVLGGLLAWAAFGRTVPVVHGVQALACSTVLQPESTEHAEA